MSKRNVDVVRAYYECLNSRDFDRCSEILAADFELVEPSLPDGGSFRGSSGWRRWLEGLNEAWSDVQFEPTDFIEAGEYVIVPVHIATRGAFTTIEQIAHRVHTIRVEDGLVTFATGYESLALAREAIGMPR